MQIIAAENLQGLAEGLPTQYRDFVRIFGKATQASLPPYGKQDMCHGGSINYIADTPTIK